MSDKEKSPQPPKKKQKAFKPPTINYIEPIVDEVERFVYNNMAKVNNATGIVSIECDDNGHEYKPLTPKKLAARITYASEYPPGLPHEERRVLTAIDVYAERIRKTALESIKKDLLIHPQRKSRGNTNLEPLRQVLRCGIHRDVVNHPKMFEQAVLIVAHMMQNVLRKLVGLRDRDVTAPIFHGLIGGTGKTEFVRNFVQPVLGDFFFESAFDQLFERFGFRPWNYYYMLFGDEMSVSRSDRELEIAEIKRTMSCDILSNRGMQSEESTGLRRNATLIGTSNPHPSKIVGDENSRRFYPIPFTDVIYDELKHNLVADVRPQMVKDAWRGIDPFIGSYAAEVKAEVRELQAATMRRTDWVDDALSMTLRPTDPNLKTGMCEVTRALKNYRQTHGISARVPSQGDLAERLKAVYKVEVKRSGANGEWVLHGHHLVSDLAD